MSRKEVVSTSIRSKQILPRAFQCPRTIDEPEWILNAQNNVIETNFDCEVTCSRQSLMTNYNKPKKGRNKKQKSPVYKVNEVSDESGRCWNVYTQANNISCELITTNNNHNNEKETDNETVEDIEKWLKTRTESISSIEMDGIKSEVDEGVSRYLGDELQHVFLEKHTNDLSIDIDLSDKKLNLGYDPILQELQSEKLLEVCEKDGFILPEFQLDQLDPLSLAPNDMVVAGEILPSTSNQPSLINDPVEYSTDTTDNEPLNSEDICDKSTQVNAYDLHELDACNAELVNNSENLHHLIDERSDFQDIQTVENTINTQIKCSSAEPILMSKTKLQPSIMKKRRKIMKIDNNIVNEDNDTCQSVNQDEIMAVVAISTDKRSNMTQIVINTGKGEQIYQGKTSELMEATGYFSKPDKINTANWNHSIENCNDNTTSMNNHELIITSALEELGYTDDKLMSVALPENGKTWICPRDDCRREFSRLYALKSHLLSHYGVRPFKVNN